jgi:hypothetical protein
MPSDHRLRLLFSLLIAMLPPIFARAEDKKIHRQTLLSASSASRFVSAFPASCAARRRTASITPFSEIKPPYGRYRGFTANGDSYAIDGSQPWDVGGPAVTVLKPGPPGSPSSCGQWLGHVEPARKTLLSWVHQETACDYAKGGQTHAQLSIATSEE